MVYALVIAFFIFIVGYFLGKKYSTEVFREDLEHQAFSDHIHHSLQVLYGANQKTDDLTQESSDESLAHPDEPCFSYSAQLTSFHSPVSAKQFVDKLAKKGITVSVIKKTSVTQQGKTIRWYQIVTQDYATEHELVTLVDALKRSERLTNVPIIKKQHTPQMKGIS
jgi:hypothetical protein